MVEEDKGETICFINDKNKRDGFCQFKSFDGKKSSKKFYKNLIQKYFVKIYNFLYQQSIIEYLQIIEYTKMVLKMDLEL